MRCITLGKKNTTKRRFALFAGAEKGSYLGVREFTKFSRLASTVNFSLAGQGAKYFGLLLVQAGNFFLPDHNGIDLFYFSA
jgi:hypothetical protein